MDSSSKTSTLRSALFTLGGMYPRSVAIAMRMPDAENTKPHGSAASCGMVNGEISIAPIRNGVPA